VAHVPFPDVASADAPECEMRDYSRQFRAFPPEMRRNIPNAPRVGVTAKIYFYAPEPILHLRALTAG